MSESFDDRRLDQVVDLIVQLASGDLSARLEPSGARDSLDAVITGINLLAGERFLVVDGPFTGMQGEFIREAEKVVAARHVGRLVPRAAEPS